VARAHDDDTIMRLVELALNQPPEAREAWLRTACAGDAELFSLVWDYVQWNNRMQGFLLEPLFPPPAEHPFAPGDLLADRFRIVREVAEGGMGIVYEATDERLERRIAIKCAKRQFRGRLPPEVRHAGEISHPNVCKTFDIHTASTARGEIDFLTMEFIEGETLAERLRGGSLADAEAREIARQLCAGLAEAHRKGVIHGDLKSNNVILTSTLDGAVRAVITDFGLARQPRFISDQAASGRQLGSGPVGGAPGYMAPELMNGGKPTVASDVYALGVILRELFSGSDAGQSPRRDNALARCLDPDPAQRFADADGLLRAIEPPRALRWIAGAVAAVVLAGVISGVTTYERATAPEETVRLALLPIQSSPDTANLAARLSKETTLQLARLKGDSRVSAVFLKPAGVASQSATHVFRVTLKEEEGNDVIHASLTDLRSGVDTNEVEMRYRPEQLKYVPVALAGIVTSSLRLPPVGPEAEVKTSVRPDYLRALSWVTSNTHADESIALLQRVVGSDPDSPLAWAGLAEAQWLKSYLSRDADWKTKAQESVRQAELRNPDVPEVRLISGWLKKNSGQYERAEVDLKRVLDLQPDNGTAWRRLGMTYENSGLINEALAALQKAAQVSPEDLRNHLELGHFYTERSRYGDAVSEFRKMVSLAPDLSASHYNLGVAYLDQKKFAEAETEFRTALEKAIENGDRATAEQALATIYSDQGKNKEAAELYRQAIQIGPETALLWLDLGWCYSRQGLESDADKAFSKGLPLAVGEVAADSRNGLARARLAYLEARLHDLRRAELDIDNALQASPDLDTQWIAVFSYEALGGEAHRQKVLDLLAASPSLINDLKNFPELADLRRDPRYKKLTGSNEVQ
jgi:serine/threonine protein kinase